LVVRKATAQEVQILPVCHGCGVAALLDQSRSAGMGNVFPAEVPHGMQMPPTHPAHLCNLMF
jgi:formamidopyrimidine-DNA glycosylase